MVKSMTGYGKGELSINSRNYQVEIKSINHRYLDISIKMPRILSYLEEDVKKVISNKISRGKVDVFITFENTSAEGREVSINTELASIYINELKKLANKENINSNIEVIDISKFPDVLSIKNTQDDDKIKEELINVTNTAVERLKETRKQEGIKLAEDILERLQMIKQKKEIISNLSTCLIEEYIVKLESRIKEILKDQEIDKTRLAQEVVIYADKCSVEEEVTRLDSHILQFQKLLNTDEAIGKKLDFIIQEMNRETNTIGSKANNLEITNEVIDIKTEIENIREQIQNIE